MSEVKCRPERKGKPGPKTVRVTPQEYRQRLVDELLAKSSFGERWAAVWLDLAGDADRERVPHIHVGATNDHLA